LRRSLDIGFFAGASPSPCNATADRLDTFPLSSQVLFTPQLSLPARAALVTRSLLILMGTFHFAGCVVVDPQNLVLRVISFQAFGSEVASQPSRPERLGVALPSLSPAPPQDDTVLFPWTSRKVTIIRRSLTRQVLLVFFPLLVKLIFF